MKSPRITFFCQVDTNVLQALFALPDIVDLATMNASVCLGLVDLSDGRAEVVQRLNRAGVPVIAWLLLPQNQEHGLNLEDQVEAASRYAAFKEWTIRHDLNWSGIGLDFEADYSLMQEIVRLTSRPWKLAWLLIRRSLRVRRFSRTVDAYRALMAQIHSDGYPVESYQFPFIVDERLIHSTFLQRALGIFDMPVNKEVLMVYSSFVRPNGAGLIWSYGRRAEALALGSTGEEAEVMRGPNALDPHPLTWEELARDLRLAWVFTNDIYLFSLEGCVRQGMLPKLKNFDWDQPILEPTDSTIKIDAWRNTLRSALWIFVHPLAILSGLLGLGLLWLWLRRRKKPGAR